MFKHLFRNWLSPRKPANVVRRARPQLERLEDRAVPATFTVINPNDSGAGSFRQALLDANAQANDPSGPDNINFALAASGAGASVIINILSALPDVTDAVDINGLFLVGGEFRSPLLSGINAGAANGLVFRSQAPSKLEHVLIENFQQNGVVLLGQDTTVRRCRMTDNGQAGILVAGGAAGNQILNNFVEDNGTHGVILQDPGTNDNVISVNSFTANTFQGIALFSGPANNQILNNTVAQNGSNGIFVGRSNNNRIQGNLIGLLSVSGVNRPNVLHGICITDDASGNLIGGVGAGEGNTIAFNGADGVLIGREPSFDFLGLVTAGTGNAVLGNSIFSNIGQGIDLGNNDGPTLNDVNDADLGPNNLQNRPFISFFQGSRLHRVEGTLASKPNTTYRIEFFLNSTADVEGETFVGSQGVTTNSAGTVAFSKTFQGPFPTGKTYSVTATSIIGGIPADTSEFGFNVAPMIRNDALTPSINEGQHATLSGNLIDPDPLDTLTLRVNWGDGSPVQEFHPGLDTFAFRHRYLDNGTYDVHFVWLDDQGGSNSRTRQVVVHNVAPELTDVRLDLDGRRLELTGRIVDPGRDSYTLVVHWGDGDSDTYQFRKGTTDFEVHHRYDDPGRYKVRLDLSDDDGGKDRESMVLDLASRGRRDDAWWIALCEFLRD